MMHSVNLRYPVNVKVIFEVLPHYPVTVKLHWTLLCFHLGTVSLLRASMMFPHSVIVRLFQMT